MNWSIFQSIYSTLDQPLLAQINTLVSNMLSAVSSILNAALTVYVALIGYLILAGRTSEPIAEIWTRLAKAAIVAGFLSASTYNQYVSNFFLTSLPQAIASTFTGGTQVGASAFDSLWNKAFSGGLAVWRNLGTFDIGEKVAVAIYWIVAAIACAYGFMVWLASHILLGLFIIFGPLTIAAFLFSGTRALTERWIGATLSMVVLQAMVTAVLSILLGVEATLLQNINANGSNAFAQIQVLFGAVILFLVGYDVLRQLPSAATALAGGMYFHSNAIARATWGAAAGAANRAVASARSAAGSAGRAAQNRLTTRPSLPPGPALSGATP